MRRPHLLLLISGLVIAVACLLPVAYLLLRATTGGYDFWPLLWTPETGRILLTSLALAGSVTITAVLLGTSLAWITRRTLLPANRLFSALLVMPLVFPSYIAAYAYISSFGNSGLLTTLFGPLPAFKSFWAAWIALSLMTYPYVMLYVRAGLQQLDGSLEEAALSMGHRPTSILWNVTLPQIRPAIFGSALLVALYVLSDFGAVALFQVDTFTRKIYTYSNLTPKFRQTAAIFSLVLIGVTFLILAAELKLRGPDRNTGTMRAGKPFMRVSLGRWLVPCLLFIFAILGFGLFLPLLVLFGWLIRAIQLGEPLSGSPMQLVNSFGVSFSAACFTVLAALVVAYLSKRYRSRTTTGIERAAYIGHALPGVVIALAMVFFSLHLGWLYQSLFILIVAYSIHFLPQASGSIGTSLLQLNPQMADAGRSLGRSRLDVLLHVTLPQIRPGMLTGFALVFLTCMKELPATLMLRPTGFDTLATYIWTNTEEPYYTRAALPSILLVGISALSIWLILRQEDQGAKP